MHGDIVTITLLSIMHVEILPVMELILIYDAIASAYVRAILFGFPGHK